MSRPLRSKELRDNICKQTGKTQLGYHSSADIMIRAYVNEGLQMGMYRCEDCNRHHLTRQTSRAKFKLADAIVYQSRRAVVNDLLQKLR